MGNLTGLPNYNYGIQIQLLDDDDSVLPMKDKDGISKDYVVFSNGSTLSDVMVLNADPFHQNVKMKLEIVPKAPPIKLYQRFGFHVTIDESRELVHLSNMRDFDYSETITHPPVIGNEIDLKYQVSKDWCSRQMLI